ncbi:MAG: winged helix-turn-helix transcriptional regulator [Rickettsiales bacterium]|jgi:DNA-binding transcriptional ArsR family regulator|nr:winged helix-turn-helix transcriptional regulator [Rickettsiales bacterium]
MTQKEKIKFLKAIASEKRFEIVQILKAHPNGITPTALSEKLGVSLSTLSLHLLRMKNTNIVRQKKVRNFIFYFLNRELIENFSI